MRIYQEGFELDDTFITQNDPSVGFLPIARWIRSGLGASYVSTATQDVHTNPNGDGGIRAIAHGSVNSDRRHVFSPELPFNMRYGWVGFAMRAPLIGPPDTQFGFSYISGGFDNDAKQMDISVDFTGLVSIRVATTPVNTALAVLTPGHHWYAVEYFCDDTNGFINVWVDDILWVSFSGDTKGDGTFDYWDQLQVSFGDSSSLDDIVVNAATITYTAGTSTPTLGATVTGGTSGATAVITDFLEPLTAGEGYIVLEPLVSTAPSGFVSGEVLTDGFGWSATSAQKDIDANGLDKNSGRPPENILLLLRPISDVSVTLVGQDGNSVDNFLNVDDDPFGDTSDYNEGTIIGEEDVYELENMPFSPESIEAVEVVTYATRAGGIAGIEQGVDPGLGVTYGAPDPTGSGGSYAKGSEIFDVNPDTGTEWTEGQVNATDVGIRLA